MRKNIIITVTMIVLVAGILSALFIPMITKKKWTRPVKIDKSEVIVLSIKRGDRANFPDFFLVRIDGHEYAIARFTTGLTMVHHVGCSARHSTRISF